MTTQLPALAPLDVQHHDDPKVVKEAATEDYTTHVVPLSWRMPRPSLAMSFYALVSGMFYLVTAATLAATVGTTDALIGILLACAAFGALGYAFSRYAARTGLTVALMSQRIFGTSGSLLGALVLAATAIYYAVFESSMIANAFHVAFPQLSLALWSAIAVAINLPLVMGGIRRWMDKYNAILLPVYWVGLMVVVVMLAMRNDSSGWLAHPPQEGADFAAPGWLYAFFVYLGVLVLMMFTVDFARFGKSEQARSNGIAVFGPVFYAFVYLANGLIGIFIAYSAGLDGAVSSELVGNTMVSLLGGWGLFLVWVTQARINTANFYVASTNMEALVFRLFRVRVPRVVAVLFCGAITYVFMLTDVVSYLLVALAWQGAFIASWVGVALVHLVRTWNTRDIEEFRAGRVRRFTWNGAVWVATSLLGILLYQFGGAFGAAWSTPITLALAVVLAAVVDRTGRGALLRRAHDPRSEVDDPWEARVRCHVCDHSYVAVEMDRDPSAEGQPPICAACGVLSTAYLQASRREHAALTAAG